MVQGDEPDWRPLLEAVGDEVTSHFMWMYEVELSSGKRLHVYKHVDTRCSVHLDHWGNAFVYEPPDRYRAFPLPDLLAAVLAPLPGLAGVTLEQIGASWAAIERLRQ
jgi:hypothetical protein